MTDRTGIVPPLLISALALGLGFVLAGYAPNLAVFTAAHALIGVGAGTGFGPMMADISHWFVRRRGLAVVVVASGNYFAGTIWPFLMSLTIPVIGWRETYAGIGVIVAAALLPLVLMMRRRPSATVFDQAEAATEAARADVGISPRLLLVLLVLAGFSCCVAMSMPQVHIVAYCGDLGYGAARGAQMLSLMLACGILSRLISGAICDRIGGLRTVMTGSACQAVAIACFLLTQDETGPFFVSAAFGLGFSGIIPSYSVAIRDHFPSAEASWRMPLMAVNSSSGMRHDASAEG